MPNKIWLSTNKGEHEFRGGWNYTIKTRMKWILWKHKL